MLLNASEAALNSMLAYNEYASTFLKSQDQIRLGCENRIRFEQSEGKSNYAGVEKSFKDAVKKSKVPNKLYK